MGLKVNLLQGPTNIGALRFVPIGLGTFHKLLGLFLNIHRALGCESVARLDKTRVTCPSKVNEIERNGRRVRGTVEF